MNGLLASSLSASNAEPSPARKALTAVVLAATLFAAVIVQLTVVNRLPLPGGAVPDLVLLLVTAIAVCTSPLTGALAGFAAGLALDVAPPAVHYAGEYALVFCLAGWGAARVNRAIWDMRGVRDPVVAFTVMAGAAAAGEAGKAALGMMLSDPDVTGAAAGRVLPTAILYDLLAAPFAFWLAARITRGTGFLSTIAVRAPAPEFGVEQRPALVFRSASAGAAPGLRLAGTGENYHRPQAARRVPRLRLADGRAGSVIGTGGAAPGTAAVPLAGGRTPRLSFGGDLPAGTGQVRTGRRAARTPGKNWLRGASGVPLAGSRAFAAHAAAARRAARGPGRGWLAVAGTAGPAVPAAQRASRAPGKGWITAGSLARPGGQRASRIPGKGWIAAGSLAGPAAKRAARGPGRGWLHAARPGGGGLAGPGGPRSAEAALAARSAPSGLSALSGGGTPMAAMSRHGAPRAGWLGAARSAAASVPAPRLAPRRGWLSGTSRPPGAVLGGHGPAGGSRGGRSLRASAFRGSRAYRGNWYAAAPSGGWLRRSRRRWHGLLPGGRPPVPRGARPMAKTGIRSAARRLGLFGGRW